MFGHPVSRRTAIRLGTAGLFGLPVTARDLLAGSGAPSSKPSKEMSFIYVFLHGGLSTIDTFDLKPEAPAEFRGEFKGIPTTVPGLTVCEHLPQVAQAARHFSVIRSFRHHNSDHGPADHYMLTGYFPTAGFNPNLSPNNQRPAFGSVVSAKLGPRGSVPPYVCLPKVHPSFGSAYLGPNAAPFGIDGDPNAPSFRVPDVVAPDWLSADRLSDRKSILETVEKAQRNEDIRANESARTADAFQRRAFELMTSPAAKKSFDIGAESPKLRDAYGRHSLGQCCLMARRLVEAGVRCVTIDHSNWDTHDNNFGVLKKTLLPQLDSAMSMLFRDLSDRGMLENTLVLVTGEFGRTPRINKNAGRDHWGPAFSVMLGGGGVKGGRILGKTDARAEKPAENPYGPEDLSATIFQALGIDPKGEMHTQDGRPMAVVNGGKVIEDLL